MKKFTEIRGNIAKCNESSAVGLSIKGAAGGPATQTKLRSHELQTQDRAIINYYVRSPASHFWFNLNTKYKFLIVIQNETVLQSQSRKFINVLID